MERTTYLLILDTPEKRLFPYYEMYRPVIENELTKEDFTRLKEKFIDLENDESKYISLIPLIQNTGVKP